MAVVLPWRLTPAMAATHFPQLASIPSSDTDELSDCARLPEPDLLRLPLAQAFSPTTLPLSDPTQTQRQRESAPMVCQRPRDLQWRACGPQGAFHESEPDKCSLEAHDDTGVVEQTVALGGERNSLSQTFPPDSNERFTFLAQEFSGAAREKSRVRHSRDEYSEELSRQSLLCHSAPSSGPMCTNVEHHEQLSGTLCQSSPFSGTQLSSQNNCPSPRPAGGEAAQLGSIAELAVSGSNVRRAEEVDSRMEDLRAAQEDVEMRILMERLQLLKSQRELAALRCERFTNMLNAFLEEGHSPAHDVNSDVSEGDHRQGEQRLQSGLRWKHSSSPPLIPLSSTGNSGSRHRHQLSVGAADSLYYEAGGTNKRWGKVRHRRRHSLETSENLKAASPPPPRTSVIPEVQGLQCTESLPGRSNPEGDQERLSHHMHRKSIA